MGILIRMNELLLFLGLSLAINIAMFVPAFLFKTDKLTDISYSVTFIVLSLLAFGGSDQSNPHFLTLLFVSVWALRLGGFLLYRIWNQKRDKRFDGMRENFFKFLNFWLLQGVSVFVVLIAALVFWTVDSPVLTTVSWLGALIFGAGLLIEATADIQKYRFSQRKSTKGTWIDEGLWAASRHPNYLGEIMVWSGLYLFVLPSLSGWQIVIALLSPIFISSLLLFVSGVPLLEKSADKKWGKQKDYQNYKKAVPVLVPTISSIKRSIQKN
jgi:steroid 5-alpha reductase family enzyme